MLTRSYLRRRACALAAAAPDAQSQANIHKQRELGEEAREARAEFETRLTVLENAVQELRERTITR